MNIDFLRRLYQYCEGTIELRPLPSGKQRFFETDDFQGIEDYCRQVEEQNIFFGVATRDGGGTKDNIINIPTIWCDVDFKDTPGEILAEKLKAFPFKPSIAVRSGGGAHLYWNLREPAEKVDIATVEDVNRRIAVALGGDLKACDAARVLRMPDTLNRKYDPPRPCKVTRMDDFTYNLEDFLEILPPAPKQEKANTSLNNAGWLEKLMEGVESGSRNDAGARIAGYYINKLPARDVLTILRTWNRLNSPPLVDSELQTIAKSVSRYQPNALVKGSIDIAYVYDAERMLEAYHEHIANLRRNRFITGVAEIDKRIRGVAAGEVLVIIARSGSFKTAMLQNMLWRYSQSSVWSSVFFSLEMPVASVAERYLQMFEGVSGCDIESMFSNDDQTHSRQIASRYFCEGLQRYYTIPTRVSLPDIAEYIKLIESEKNTKVGVVGIDYLGLLDGPGSNSYEMVSRLARGVKGLAKMLGLPVVLLSQVSRKGESGKTAISLEMGRDSGAIEESADFVLGLWQQEGLSDDSEPPPVELICRILKNRKGPIGSTWKLELEAHAMQIGTGATPYIQPKPPRGIEL